MYALLNENDELVNDTPVAIYYGDGAITLPDGTQFPANWMRVLSAEDKAGYHIFPMTTTDYDPSVTTIVGDPSYSFDGTTVSETYVTEPVSLIAYKQAKMSELLGAKGAAISEPVFLTFGQTQYAFSTALEARVLLLHVVTAMNAGLTLPPSFTWASIDYPNIDSPTHESKVVSGVTPAQVKELAEAMITHEYTINKQYVELLEAVDNATTHAEVDAIVWV